MRVVNALPACAECLNAVKAKPFRVALAKQAYMIDLTMLTFHCYHSSPEDLQRFKDSLRDRDYQKHNLAGQDIDRFLRIKQQLGVVPGSGGQARISSGVARVGFPQSLLGPLAAEASPVAQYQPGSRSVLQPGSWHDGILGGRCQGIRPPPRFARRCRRCGRTCS